MNITSKKIHDHLAIVIDGMIDANSASLFQATCEQLHQENVKHILIDFSRITHISAQGIHVLFLMLQNLKKDHRQLILLAIPAHLQLIIDVLALAEQIPIATNEEQALGYLNEGAIT